MPDIKTIWFDLTGRHVAEVESWLKEIVGLPLDDVPLVRDHAHLTFLVRQSLAPIIFRVEDDPRILCVWQSASSAAIAFTLWRRTLRFIDIMLIDDAPVFSLPCPCFLSPSEIRSIGRERRPLLVRCAVRNGSNAIPEVLGLIAFMPVYCDLRELT